MVYKDIEIRKSEFVAKTQINPLVNVKEKAQLNIIDLWLDHTFINDEKGGEDKTTKMKAAVDGFMPMINKY